MQPKRQCNAETFFKDWFLRLRGFTPYPWQMALFLAVLAGTPPSLLYIPTGGGKTDVITAWLLAVLWQIEQTRTTAIPRRLYFAVDRRVVVDQTSPLAETLLEEVRNEPELFHLLRSQTPSEKPLVISVLRGQRVTEQEPLIEFVQHFEEVLSLCVYWVAVDIWTALRLTGSGTLAKPSGYDKEPIPVCSGHNARRRLGDS